jgi:hypothetical protein
MPLAPPDSLTAVQFRCLTQLSLALNKIERFSKNSFFLLVLYIVQLEYCKLQYIVHVKKKTNKKALAPVSLVCQVPSA